MGNLNLGRKPEVAPAEGEASVPAGEKPRQSLFGELLTMATPFLKGILDRQVKQQMGQVVQGGNQHGNTPAPPDNKPAAAGLPLNRNPEDVLHQFEAMIVHDITRLFGNSMDKASQAIKPKVLVINATQDRAGSPEIPQQFAELIKAGKFMLTGACGHKACKPDCEIDKLVPVIANFLNAPARASAFAK